MSTTQTHTKIATSRVVHPFSGKNRICRNPSPPSGPIFQESFDGATFLFLIGADDIYLVHPLLPQRVGTDVKLVRARGVDGAVYNYGEQIADVTEEGRWFHNLSPAAQGTASQRELSCPPAAAEQWWRLTGRIRPGHRCEGGTP